MKGIVLLALSIAACAPPGAKMSDAKAEFLAVKSIKDRLYAEREDCPQLMSMFAEDVAFWVKGRRMRYDYLVDYCPKLPKEFWLSERALAEPAILSSEPSCEGVAE